MLLLGENLGEKRRGETDGQRISLLPINESYASEIFKEFDSEITRYMLPKPAENIEETLTFIRNSLEGMKEGNELVLVITKRDDGEFLGCCGLHGRGKPRTPELGIWLRKDAHGNQYGKEAIRILISWAAKHIDFDYAIYPVDKANAASRKIAESLGGSIFEEKKMKTMNGRYLDEVVYRISNEMLKRQSLNI